MHLLLFLILSSHHSWANDISSKLVQLPIVAQCQTIDGLARKRIDLQSGTPNAQLLVDLGREILTASQKLVTDEVFRGNYHQIREFLESVPKKSSSQCSLDSIKEIPLGGDGCTAVENALVIFRVVDKLENQCLDKREILTVEECAHLYDDETLRTKTLQGKILPNRSKIRAWLVNNSLDFSRIRFQVYANLNNFVKLPPDWIFKPAPELSADLVSLREKVCPSTTMRASL